jgi:DNA-binding ferritin-like protein
LADSIVLYDLYRGCDDLARIKEKYGLCLLLETHALEQLDAIDQLIDRIESLGGRATTHSRQVAELSAVRQPSGRVNDIEAMLSWLADVHNLIAGELRTAIGVPAKYPGAGSIEEMLRDTLCRHERQLWLVAKYLAESRRSVPRLVPHRQVNLHHPAGRGIR